MAIQKVNFEIVAPSHTALIKRDTVPNLGAASSNMPTSLNPNNTSSTLPRLLDGEWMNLTDTGKFTRAGYGITTAGAATTADCQKPAYPIWVPHGDYSVQQVGSFPLIFLGTFEAWTQLYKYNNTNDPLANFSVGDRLIVIEGQPDADSSAKHSVLIKKDTTTNGVNANGMVLGFVIGKDNSRGLHIYAQAGGFGVWF